MSRKGCNALCRAVTLTLVALTALGVLVSGCGESATARRLRSRLLSAADLPAGWSGVATGGGTVKLANTPCLSGLAKHAKRWSYHTAVFVEGESVPNLGEVLATGPGVDAGLESI